MEEETIGVKEPEYGERTALARWVSRIIKFLLCIIILGASSAGAYYIVTTGPRPKMQMPIKHSPIVSVMEMNRSDESVIVSAMGTVIPARQIVLKSRVSGEIEYLHPEFTEGGLVKKGSELIKLDQKDYKLAIEQSKSQIASTEYALKLEMGHQEVAKREWELINGNKKADELDEELALRKPHLEKAKADLAAARANLKQTELNLKRTSIRAPFNAIIRSKKVDLGSQVSPQDQLAELVGVDEFRVQVSLPMDRLKWIDIPRRAGEKGSKVHIRYGREKDSEQSRTGTVVKLLSDLEAQGRMARILVSVKDPLGFDKKGRENLPLLIDEFVHVDIEGRKLDNVVKVPRTALRDNLKIWVLGEGKKLEIRDVVPVWRTDRDVLLDNGIKDGEQLILSILQTPVQGMHLRLEGDKPTPASGGQGPGPFPGGAPPKGGFMGMFDKNKDGKVSKSEFKGPSFMFKRFDKDGDGFVSKEEAPTGPPPGGGPPPGFPKG